MDKSTFFEKELNYIKNPKIKEFTIKILEIVPDYFWIVPSSSTGKYHPNVSLGEGGLARHIKACIWLANDLLNNQIFNKYTDDQKDIILSALFLHDCLKSGFPQQKYTKHEHPLLMVEFIKNQKDICSLLPESILNEILSGILSHMGEWGTSNYSKIILPKPETKIQNFIHMIDYLSSRKYMELNFNIE